MDDALWLLEHQEHTTAGRAFVWEYLSDVANWDDPPARFALDGPFRAGAAGTTTFPDAGEVHWVLRNVRSGHGYTVESAVDRAHLLCVWELHDADDGGTRLVQRIGLTGQDAVEHAARVRSAFEPGLASGMRRLAERLAGAERSTR
jgi:Polyketide cyclase / dehydrase and lipid transport